MSGAPTKLPLAGVRVADFTWVWAGPFCTLQLAHLGAEVIRIESATRPCVTRLLPPWPQSKPGVNRSGYFNQYNQGKLSLALDLKQPRAVELAKELVSKCDVVCENFAAGVMDRLGLGYEALRRHKPDIIMIALSGYGATGPESDFVSYGPAQVPLAGLSSLTGYADWPPMHVGISYGDPTAGLHGAFAVLAALLHRQRTGEGQFIDLSQQETTVAVIPEGTMDYAMNQTQPARQGNRDAQMAPHGIFRCAGEQRWVAIAVRSDGEWTRLATMIDADTGSTLASEQRFRDLSSRKLHEDALEEALTAWTTNRSAEAITTRLQAARIPAFPCFDSRDISNDSHLQQSGLFVELEHPEIGKQRHIGIPWRLSGTPTQVRTPAPCLGEHTDWVLREILGYDGQQVAKLKDDRVLY